MDESLSQKILTEVRIKDLELLVLQIAKQQEEGSIVLLKLTEKLLAIESELKKLTEALN